MIIYKLDFKPQKAFTLVELLVVVAIIGILASIAVPSYQNSVANSRRADAKGCLFGLANAMERHFTVNSSYMGAGGTNATPADSGAPRIYSATCPISGNIPYYNITIVDTTTANAFDIQAAPTGAQANERCGTLTLDQTGLKGISGAVNGLTVDDCW